MRACSGVEVAGLLEVEQVPFLEVLENAIGAVAFDGWVGVFFEVEEFVDGVVQLSMLRTAMCYTLCSFNSSILCSNDRASSSRQ